MIYLKICDSHSSAVKNAVVWQMTSCSTLQIYRQFAGRAAPWYGTTHMFIPDYTAS